MYSVCAILHVPFRKLWNCALCVLLLLSRFAVYMASWVGWSKWENWILSPDVWSIFLIYFFASHSGRQGSDCEGIQENSALTPYCKIYAPGLSTSLFLASLTTNAPCFSIKRIGSTIHDLKFDYIVKKLTADGVNMNFWLLHPGGCSVSMGPLQGKIHGGPHYWCGLCCDFLRENSTWCSGCSTLTVMGSWRYFTHCISKLACCRANTYSFFG